MKTLVPSVRMSNLHIFVTSFLMLNTHPQIFHIGWRDPDTRGPNSLTLRRLLIFAFFRNCNLISETRLHSAPCRIVILWPAMSETWTQIGKISFMRFLPNSIFVVNFIEEMEKNKILPSNNVGSVRRLKIRSEMSFGCVGCHNGWKISAQAFSYRLKVDTRIGQKF